MIQTCSSSSASRPRARPTAAARARPAHDAEHHREPLRVRVPDQGEGRARRERRCGDDPMRGEATERSTPTNAPSGEHADGHQPGEIGARGACDQPASSAHARRPRRPGGEGAPAVAVDGRRRVWSARRPAAGTTAAGGDQEVTGLDAGVGEGDVRRRAARPVGCTGWGRTSSPDWRAYSSATSTPRHRRDHQVEDADGAVHTHRKTVGGSVGHHADNLPPPREASTTFGRGSSSPCRDRSWTSGSQK